jgi:hypothetical protein
MKLLIAFAVCGMLLAGCSTTPVSIGEADPVPANRHLSFKQSARGTVPVVIRRDSGFMSSACATQVFVNGSIAAYVRSGEIVTLHIPAGNIILGAQPDGICAGGLIEREATLIPGRTAHYRIGYDHNGAIGLYATATR